MKKLTTTEINTIIESLALYIQENGTAVIMSVLDIVEKLRDYEENGLDNK